MLRAPTLAIAAALCACASSGSPPSESAAPASASAADTTPAHDQVRALANLAALRIIVAPAYGLEAGDPMGWAASIQRPRAVLRELDSAIVTEFTARGLHSTWYFAPDLEQSYRLNSTYAADPYNLAENPVRGTVELGKNYGEPLATQLRTMIAMQDGARRVILPVNLRFEAADSGRERAVLKLVLVDARTTEYVWTGEVKSDPASAFGPDVLKSLAFHFADMVVAP